MPSIGPLEILVVGVIALIVFGPQKLPEIARSIGRTASELRRMASEVRDEFEAGINLEDRDEGKDEEDEEVEEKKEEEEKGDHPAPTSDEAATSTAPQTNKVVDAAAGDDDPPER
jgi:Tat protein translocase TatB subunit